MTERLAMIDIFFKTKEGKEGSEDSCDNLVEPCDHICTVTAGRALCSCNPGFTLQPDGRTCAGQFLSDSACVN